MKYFKHSTAEVSEKATVGKNCKIWNEAQVREKAKIGKNCVIGKGAYIDSKVIIGNNVKIQNYALIYHYAIIENGVFIGPNACLTNDKFPRAVDIKGDPKNETMWQAGKIIIKKGASIGAGSIILPDVAIGKYAIVGAGSIVTKNVPDFALVVGNPAKLRGYINKEGKIIKK